MSDRPALYRYVAEHTETSLDILADDVWGELEPVEPVGTLTKYECVYLGLPPGDYWIVPAPKKPKEPGHRLIGTEPRRIVSADDE